MRAIPVNPARLAEQLEPSAVDIESLKANYGPMLKLVKELIGVVPNADAFLAIWPTGFRTYNLLVPNLLNLPVSLWGGGAPKALVGLAMYAASRTAGCAYCSAHTCSFALRRGASPSTLMGAHPNPHEAAVVTIAEALARVPCDLSAAQVHTFAECFSADHREWILLGIGLMGFLNKAMDALGVPLEAESIAVAAPFLKFKESLPNATMSNPQSGTQQTAPQPPVDSIGTFFRVLQQAPAAIRLERQWTAGVPNRWPAAGTFLEQHTGYSFPLLGRLRHKRVIRALTTVLRDNLRHEASDLGLPAKCLSGLVYATVVQNQPLAAAAQQLTAHLAPTIDAKVLDQVAQFAAQPTGDDQATLQQAIAALSSLPPLSEQTAAALLLAQAAAPSPAAISPALLSVVSPHLTPSSMVELIIWLSIQQLLHRLSCFYAVANRGGTMP